MAQYILVTISGSEESLHPKGEEELYSVIHFNSYENRYSWTYAISTFSMYRQKKPPNLPNK